jgi:hypothetical protein
MVALTDDQVIVIIFFNSLSSMLSIFGSSTIIYLLGKAKRPSVYSRLMLGISFFDVINTIFLSIAPFLLPKSGGRKWAFGNDLTCSILGFFAQLGCAVPFYNISLNIFFFLTVVYGINESRIVTFVEPFLHIISIFYPLITASFGVGFNLYSELELGVSCWIGEFPQGCNEDPNVECISTMIGWIYSGIPIVGSFVVLTTTNFLIYRKVRLATRQSLRYSIDNVIARCSTVTPKGSVDMSPELRTNVKEKTAKGGKKPSNTFSKINDQDNATGSLDSRHSELIGLRQNQGSKNTKQAVLTQATLYVLASFTTTLCMSILRIIESEGVKRQDESNLFLLTLLTHITYPLQGFWNFLIYIRPRYLRWRHHEPTLSRYWALKQCMACRNPGKSASKDAPTPLP